MNTDHRLYRTILAGTVCFTFLLQSCAPMREDTAANAEENPKPVSAGQTAETAKPEAVPEKTEEVPLRTRIEEFINDKANPVKNNSRKSKREIWYLLENEFLKDAQGNPHAGRTSFLGDAEQIAEREKEDLVWTVSALKELNWNAGDFNRLAAYLMDAAGYFLRDAKLVDAYGEAIISYPGMGDQEKFQAFSRMFGSALDETDTTKAENLIRRLEQSVRTEKLPPHFYADYAAMRARILCIQDKCDEAAAYLRAKMNEGHKDNAMYRKLAEVYLRFRRTEDAAAVYLEAGNKTEYLKTLAVRFPERAKKIAEQYLNTPEESPEVRRFALEKFFFGGIPEDEAMRGRNPDLLAEVRPESYRTACHTAISNSDYKLLTEMISLWKKVSPAPDFERAKMELQLFAAGRKRAELKNFIEQVKNSESFSDKQRKELIFCASAVMLRNKPGVFRNFYRTYPFAEEMTSKERANLLLKASSLALNARLNTVSAEAYGVWESLFVPEEKKNCVVPFCSEPILGLGSFLRNARQANVQYLDRKYGGNMDFLVTDVATGKRAENIGTDMNGVYKPVEMRTLCDENGIHFLFTVFDDQAKDIEAGTCSPGSFEAYLAPGRNQPYYCFLPDLTGGNEIIWESAYENPQWRRIESYKNKKVLRTELTFFPNGYHCYLSLAWEPFFDKLPEKGDVWDFENIYWSRFGGYSWNGVKSIHGRSTWGNLSFELSSKQLAAVRKKIIFAAKRNYLQEKQTNQQIHGVIDRWKNDDVLGDPEFYRTQVAPLVERLDSYLPEVQADMTPETIDRIYKNAVPGWMNIRYEISELRKRYIEKRLTEEE